MNMISFNLLATEIISYYASSASAENYPSVAHTATINGFADPIYYELPECAHSCVKKDTDAMSYWNTGCICVMSNWGAECIAENCKGSEVSTATSLATSIYFSAGVPTYWYIPASDVTALLSAAEATVTSQN
ncbi:unnamed protein product [Debaryomyces tyrocola]|nr:unnamed protein product [Debaryomyces tyrocola]